MKILQFLKNNFGFYKIVIEKEEDNIFSDDEYILKKVCLNNDELEEFIQSDNDNYVKLNIKFRKEFPDLLDNPKKVIPKEEKENPVKDFECSYNKNESKKKLEEKIEKKKKGKNKSDKIEKNKDEEKENNKNNENDIQSFFELKEVILQNQEKLKENDAIILSLTKQCREMGLKIRKLNSKRKEKMKQQRKERMQFNSEISQLKDEVAELKKENGKIKFRNTCKGIIDLIYGSLFEYTLDISYIKKKNIVKKN